nr:MAG TPA: hypothetical protein [Bacteriophage sp.]
MSSVEASIYIPVGNYKSLLDINDKYSISPFSFNVVTFIFVAPALIIG